MIIDINQYPLKFFQDDGTFYTAACRSYKPSDKGLFNLQGNVAEWTSDWGWIQSFPPKSTVFEQFKLKYPNSPMAKLNVSEANAYLNRFRVVKGGSWASGPFYLQPAINEFFLPEATHSYLGFRVAMDVQ
jgi:formylglycine-generating enzyme required for sulfatase activity